MRWLLVLPLLALPLLAQEKEEQTEPQPAPLPQLEALLRKIVEAKTEEEREPLYAELRRRIANRPAISWDSTRGLSVVIGSTTGPQESLSGSWEQDGKKGKYTLKSIGKGRYELRAEIDGQEQPVRDTGTFHDLSKRHKFLRGRGGAFIFSPKFEGFTIAGNTFKVAPIIGFRLSPASDALRHHLALPQGAGLIIDEVLPGTRAARLGLKKYDILLRIDGDPVDDVAQVEALAKNEGTLEYVRRGKTRTLDLSKAVRAAK